MKDFYNAIKLLRTTNTLLILMVLLMPNWITAQNPDLGSWNILNIKYKINDRFSIFGEGQIRSLKFYDHFHYFEFKGGVNYKIHEDAQITIAGGNYQTFKEGGDFVLPKNNNEIRIWPQLILNQTITRLKIEQRYRLEMRWTSVGYRNRFRYRVGVSYAFGKDKKGYLPFQTSLSNELFFTNTAPFFQRNRSQISFNYKLTKHLAVQLGYIHQFDYQINDETGRDFLVVGFYYDLF
jgi:long-subunit fatty acid transport protein